MFFCSHSNSRVFPSHGWKYSAKVLQGSQRRTLAVKVTTRICLLHGKFINSIFLKTYAELLAKLTHQKIGGKSDEKIKRGRLMEQV